MPVPLSPGPLHREAGWYQMKSYAEIQGDGGSRIVEQVVAQKKKIEENLSGIRHLIAVGSGKGGVGKSTLAMQLALALHRKSGHVALLDADFNGPSQARMSGLKQTFFVPDTMGLALPKTAEGMGVVSLGSLVPESRAVDFESVATGESYVWRATKEFSLLGELLGSVRWGTLDALVIDLPPGSERTAQYADFFGKRLSFVLVTIPSEISQGVVARSVSALEKTGSPLLGYIENMSGYFCHDCGSVKPLFPSPSNGHLKIPRLGSLPFDPKLAELCDSGVPLSAYTELPSWKGVCGIAERVWNLLEAGIRE